MPEHPSSPAPVLSATDGPLILGIGGSMRYGSSGARALQLALDVAKGLGARTSVLSGAQLDVGPYDPDVQRGPAALRLVEAVRQADGLIIASPSYHGGVSGLLKNALDQLEELRDDARPYLRDRPVGLIATGDGWQGPNATLASLRSLVHALQGWPTPLGVAHNVTDGGGVEAARAQLELVATQVVRFATAFGAGTATAAL